MTINGVNGINNAVEQLNNISFAPPADQKSKAATAFEDFYQAALNLVDETNKYQQESEKAQLDFAIGRNDNMLSVMLAQEKATTALSFTVQVTNKIVEAYREIMRTQL